MSSGLVEERSGAETIADVIDALCVKRAEWERTANDYWQRLQHEETEKYSLEDDNQRLRRELSQMRGQRDELQRTVNHLNENAERGSANLDRLDQITLDLYLYIVELAGHRDTAKTKAERIALGHVVERLKAIRGDDATYPEAS